MKAADLRTKSAEDLNKQLIELRKEQFNLRMQAAASQQVKTDQFGKVRKNIARIKTVLNEMQADKS